MILNCVLVDRYLRRRSDDDISLESYVYHLLYYVPLPPPSRSVKLTYFGESITCPRPKSSELPLFDYFMSDLFRLLDLDSFLQLFTCVLLENQVLLYSKGRRNSLKKSETLTKKNENMCTYKIYIISLFKYIIQSLIIIRRNAKKKGIFIIGRSQFISFLVSLFL